LLYVAVMMYGSLVLASCRAKTYMLIRSSGKGKGKHGFV